MCLECLYSESRWKSAVSDLTIAFPWPSQICGSSCWNTSKTTNGTCPISCLLWLTDVMENRALHTARAMIKPLLEIRLWHFGSWTRRCVGFFCLPLTSFFLWKQSLLSRYQHVRSITDDSCYCSRIGSTQNDPVNGTLITIVHINWCTLQPNYSLLGRRRMA